MNEQRYISGEEYRMARPNKPSHNGVSSFIWILVTVAALVGLSFGAFLYLHRANNAPPTMQATQTESSGGNITAPSGGNGGSGMVNSGSGQPAGGTESSGTPCLSAGPCQR